MLKPYKHQVEAFDFIKDKPVFALFMDMGTGKSKVVLMKLEYLIKTNEIDKIIIIAPNYLKDTWITDHFKEHFDLPFISFIYEGNISTNKDKKRFNNFILANVLKVFVVNVEAFQTTSIDKWVMAFLAKDKKCMVIIDESTIIKNPKARRTIKILNGFKNIKYKGILSGTPTPNSPSDLYSQFEFLQQFYFKCNYFQFKHKYTIFTQQKTQNGIRYDAILTEKDFSIIKNALKKESILTNDFLNEVSVKYNISVANIIRINKMETYTPYKDLSSLNEQISKITFKVMKKDCLDLPDKIYEKIIIELNPEQKRIYKELTQNFFTNYKDDQLIVANTLSLLTRLRQITGGLFPSIDIDKIDFDNIDQINYNECKIVKRIENNPKIKAIIEDIETANHKTSMVIWSNFTECIRYLKDELSKYYSCETYYGDTKNREEIKASFKKGSFKILIANPETAGMGLNLQISTLHYFYDNSYRADFRTQAEDRSHRIGQLNHVVYKDVIAKNTIDEKIYNIVQNKIDLLTYFKDRNNLKEVLHQIKNF